LGNLGKTLRKTSFVFGTAQMVCWIKTGVLIESPPNVPPPPPPVSPHNSPLGRGLLTKKQQKLKKKTLKQTKIKHKTPTSFPPLTLHTAVAAPPPPRSAGADSKRRPPPPFPCQTRRSRPPPPPQAPQAPAPGLARQGEKDSNPIAVPALPWPNRVPDYRPSPRNAAPLEPPVGGPRPFHSPSLVVSLKKQRPPEAPGVWGI